MTKEALNRRYFDWMYHLVCDAKYAKGLSYRRLLERLHNTDFFYTIKMDKNRESDGIGLRYRFAYENGYYDDREVEYLDDRPCSVLEMLIALAIRCEEHIMEDPDIGDRTGQWFWNMIVNLGLGSMTDSKFDEDFVDLVISNFLHRKYAPTGEGGLFTVRNTQHNLRNVEIWYQMCWYLDEII